MVLKNIPHLHTIIFQLTKEVVCLIVLKLFPKVIYKLRKQSSDATKVEIAQAVEVLFPGAKVAKVNTISVRGRFRRQGMHAGYTAASKKAIVTLTKDSKEIEFFNSMV